MAYSYNKVVLVGNLGNDPEISNLPSGVMLAKANLATSERYQDKQTNEWKEQTQWHRLVFWDRMADIASKHLKKGSQIFVEGRIKYGQYTGNDGITRYTTDITVIDMVMLGGKNAMGDSQPFANAQNYGTASPQEPPSVPEIRTTIGDILAKNLTPDVDDEDIPF